MRVIRLLVPIAVAGVVLAGCANASNVNPTGNPPAAAIAGDNGIKDLPVMEIMTRAATATDAAGSYRVKGEATHEGQRLTADMQLKGKDISGTVTMTQGAIKVRRIGDVVYLQADPAFWKIFGPAAETIGTLFKDKWVKTSASDKQWSEFATIGDLTQLLKKFGTGTFTKGQVKTVDGVSVVELKDSTGVVIHVAATGEPYFLRVDMKGEGTLKVSDFGAKFDDVQAPPAGQVVDLSSLLGK